MTSQSRGSVAGSAGDGREGPRAGSRARDADGSPRPARPGDRRVASRRGRSAPPRLPPTPRARRCLDRSTGFGHGKCAGNETGSLDPRSAPLRVLRVESAPGAASDTGRVGAAAGLVVRTELVKSLALLAAVRAPRLHLTPALTVSALHGVPPWERRRPPLGRWAAHLPFKANASVRSLAVWWKSSGRGRRRDRRTPVPAKSPAHHGAGMSPGCAEPRPGSNRDLRSPRF